MLPQIRNFTSQFQASLIITTVTLGNWLTKHTNSRLMSSPHSSHTKPGWQVRCHHRDFSQLTHHTYLLKIYLPPNLYTMCTEAIHLHSLYSQSQICHFTTLPKTPYSCYHRFVATLIYSRPLLFSPLWLQSTDTQNALTLDSWFHPTLPTHNVVDRPAVNTSELSTLPQWLLTLRRTIILLDSLVVTTVTFINWTDKFVKFWLYQQHSYI